MFGVGYLVNIHDMKDVVDVGKSNHADVVLKNYEHFGLNEREFEYFKHHDDEDHMGLFNRIFKDGWVRIRIFRNSISFEYASISDDLMSDLITNMNLSGNYSILLEDVNSGFVDIPSYAYFLDNNSDIGLCRKKLKNKSMMSQFREQYANIINKLIKLSLTQKVYEFPDGKFTFWCAHYGSWASDARKVFRVRIDNNPKDRASQKGIKQYDRLYPATEKEIQLWMNGHKYDNGKMINI